MPTGMYLVKLNTNKHRTFPLVRNELSYGTGVHTPQFGHQVGTGTNRAKTDVFVREIVVLSACFQSVMEGSCIMKTMHHTLTHNHSCMHF